MASNRMCKVWMVFKMARELIRKATLKDMPVLLEIYERARKFMVSTGNTNQWTNGYPSKEILTEDIERNEMYVLEDEDGIQASFVFYCGIDPCYNEIYDGQWLNDEPYGVIHRIATRGLKKHMADIILEYCESKIDNIRMDTHMDNKPMQNFMLKHGFKHVGTIYLKNGQSRLAFHCNLNKN